MITSREGRNRPGVESLEGRQLTAAVAGLAGPKTAEVRAAMPSVSEIVVTKQTDDASTNLIRTAAGPSVSEIVVTKDLDDASTGL
jgi:hypothetical protein